MASVDTVSTPSVSHPDHVDPTSKHEGWTNAAARYQERIGKCTLHGTTRLIDIIERIHPFNDTSYVLDNGTGGGSLVLKIKEKHPSTKVLATDISTGMLDQVTSLHLPDVTTQREDAIDLHGLNDNIFSHVLTSFMIQFTPDQTATLNAMYRVLAPGGIVGIAIWGPNADAEIIHKRACAILDPAYQAPSPHSPRSWRSEQDQAAKMIEAGFRDVATETVRMPFECRDAEHFVEYWFDFGNPVPTKYLDDWKANGGDVVKLRTAVRDVVREQYDDGRNVWFRAVLGWGRK